MSNAGRPKITPAEVETLIAAWLRTANIAEAAREAGVSEASARRYLIRAGVKDSASLYAQALARAEREHLGLVSAARRRLREALDAAPDEAVAEITRAANDSLRAVTATKMAHAKLSGALIDRTDVTSGGAPLASVVVLPPLADDGSGATDPVAAEPGATD